MFYIFFSLFFIIAADGQSLVVCFKIKFKTANIKSGNAPNFIFIN
jgi:hypothetical protein